MRVPACATGAESRGPTRVRRIAHALAAVLVTTGAAENIHFKVLVCPSDPTTRLETYWGKTSYLANWYAFGDGKAGYFRPAQRFVL